MAIAHNKGMKIPLPRASSASPVPPAIFKTDAHELPTQQRMKILLPLFPVPYFPIRVKGQAVLVENAQRLEMARKNGEAILSTPDIQEIL